MNLTLKSKPQTRSFINPDSKDLPTEKLNLILFGHAAFQYLYAGCKLRVFEILFESKKLTKEKLVEAMELQPYPAKVLLLGLSSLNLIIKEGETYRNADVIASMFQQKNWKIFYDTVLFEGEIVYKGQIDFLASLNQNRNVGLRRFNGDGDTLYKRLSQNPGLQSVFYNYMGSWSKLSNPLLLDSVDFSQFTKILDVGGGDATNAIDIAEANNTVNITLLDIPDTCEIAEANIAKHELSSRIDVKSSNFFKDQFPKGYDCILFIHQLVIWTLEENTEVLTKAYHALEPGGKVVIFSSISSDSDDGPLMAALDSVYFMSLPADGGMIYPWKDYKACLLKAGFSKIEYIDCQGWTPHGVIIAEK